MSPDAKPFAELLGFPPRPRKVKRNAPCPCGSRKRARHCCYPYDNPATRKITKP